METGFILCCPTCSKILQKTSETNELICNCSRLKNSDTVDSWSDDRSVFSKRFCKRCGMLQFVKRCSSCKISLCDLCLNLHSTCYEGADLESSNKKQEEIKQMPFCEKHPRIEKDMFCMECQMVICLKCFALSHTRHEIKKVEEVLKFVKHNLITEMGAIENEQTTLKERSHLVQQIEADVYENEKKIIQQLDEYVDKLISEIKNSATILKEQISSYTDMMVVKVKLVEANDLKSSTCLDTLKNDLKRKINNLSVKTLQDDDYYKFMHSGDYPNKIETTDLSINFDLKLKLEDVDLNFGSLLM